MHEIAKELNNSLEDNFPIIWKSLSFAGRKFYFPKGILAQSQEANQKAKIFNATIGIATQDGFPLYLDYVHNRLSSFDAKDLYPYAAVSGRKKLRQLWQREIFKKNPDLIQKSVSLPIVTAGITNGIDLAAKMFVDAGESVVIPDLNWENYDLIFEVDKGAHILKYQLFDDNNKFNILAFEKALSQAFVKQQKVVTVLNFPNNPSGYSLSSAEQDLVVAVCKKVVPKDKLLICLADDAYFGLFFDKSCAKQSIFAKLAGVSSNILAIKLDGATKEHFMWGFRVGFITFGYMAEKLDLLYSVLEQKISGMLRTTSSSNSHPAQTILEEMLEDDAYKSNSNKHFTNLQARALMVKDIIAKNQNYKEYFECYPFNSGYFMCLKIKGIKSEDLRKKLLDEYQIGTIAFNDYDLRIAFSSVNVENIRPLFDKIYQACKKFYS